MRKSYKDTLNKQLEDSEVKAEWDSIETEYKIISAIIEGRKKKYNSKGTI